MASSWVDKPLCTFLDKGRRGGEAALEGWGWRNVLVPGVQLKAIGSHVLLGWNCQNCHGFTSGDWDWEQLLQWEVVIPPRWAVDLPDALPWPEGPGISSLSKLRLRHVESEVSMPAGYLYCAGGNIFSCHDACVKDEEKSISDINPSHWQKLNHSAPWLC